MMRITDVPMKCPLCRFECRFEECEGDGDESGTCPIADCGGLMKQMDDENKEN